MISLLHSEWEEVLDTIAWMRSDTWPLLNLSQSRHSFQIMYTKHAHFIVQSTYNKQLSCACRGTYFAV